MSRVTDLFVGAGVLAHEAGELDEALLLLAARLDLAGAGDLLSAITDRTCWQPHDAVCPQCGHIAKGDPQPHPKPPAPPPPPDPKPGR